MAPTPPTPPVKIPPQVKIKSILGITLIPKSNGVTAMAGATVIPTARILIVKIPETPINVCTETGSSDNFTITINQLNEGTQSLKVLKSIQSSFSMSIGKTRTPGICNVAATFTLLKDLSSPGVYNPTNNTFESTLFYPLNTTVLFEGTQYYLRCSDFIMYNADITPPTPP